MNKLDIRNLTQDDLTENIVKAGFQKYRAKQIFPFICKGITDFDEIGNIPKDLKQYLKDNFYFNTPKIHTVLKSQKDATRKYLILLEDGNIIESVFMKYKFGNSVCISSQVGCLMGCKFCASTIDSKIRNLTASEMISQIKLISQDTGEKISSVVIMGSGEAFDNYEEFLKFIHIINSKDGFNLGQRHITVSTCGIVPKIIDFANEKTYVNLAVSLHSPFQEKRMSIMPIAKTYDINTLMKAVKYYTQTTGRRVTYEYALIKGFNDSKADALELKKILSGQLAHINLIPVNPIDEREFKRPDKSNINNFKALLDSLGLNSTIRREMGTDINGACGQLRRSALENHNAND